MNGYLARSPSAQEMAERYRLEAVRLAVRVRTLEVVLELVVGMLAALLEPSVGGEA